MKRSLRFLLAAAVLVLAGCATTRPVDMKEPRRLVGTENGVRVDAQITTDQLTPSSSIAVTYDVTNDRPAAIAIADLLPQASYDPDTQAVTITLGSEVPGYDFVPRLLVIPSGVKKSFASRVSVNVPAVGNSVGGSFGRYPNGLQVKLHFLGDVQPFAQLVGISEKSVHDPKLADALLPKWLERNETVITNLLPMRWVGAFGEDEAVPARRRQRP